MWTADRLKARRQPASGHKAAKAGVVHTTFSRMLEQKISRHDGGQRPLCHTHAMGGSDMAGFEHLSTSKTGLQRPQTYESPTYNYASRERPLTTLLGATFDVRGLAPVNVPCCNHDSAFPSSNLSLRESLQSVSVHGDEKAEDLLSDNPTAKLALQVPESDCRQQGTAAVAFGTGSQPIHEAGLDAWPQGLGY